MDIVRTAQKLADDVLFPAALKTDAANTLSKELLDELADAGLYGLTGPTWAGGLDADFQTVCDVVEALSSGCLTTAFVWAQHIGGVRAAAGSDNALIKEWVRSLCSGERRAGLALGGALAGKPSLRAERITGGWSFNGVSPFVSGWGRIDVVHAAARSDDGELVWAFVDARETDTLVARRLELAVLNATPTARVEFRGHPVADERVSSVASYVEGATPPEALRIHASFALGVAARCCKLLGRTPLDEELSDLRIALDRLDPESIEAARGAAGELAWRAAGALAVTTGARSLLMENQAQLLAREALFVLVYALRPGSRASVLAQLRASLHLP